MASQSKSIRKISDNKNSIIYTPSQLKRMKTHASTVKSECEKLEAAIDSGRLTKVSNIFMVQASLVNNMSNAEAQIHKIIDILMEK